MERAGTNDIAVYSEQEMGMQNRQRRCCTLEASEISGWNPKLASCGKLSFGILMVVPMSSFPYEKNDDIVHAC